MVVHREGATRTPIAFKALNRDYTIDQRPDRPEGPTGWTECRRTSWVPNRPPSRVGSMGERIEFASDGSRAHGYLAIPERGATGTIGVIVIQEWWGLVDQITRTCDRFAEAGFTALAPDLYDGTAVPLTEPDEAAKHMMALRMDRAAGRPGRSGRRTAPPDRGVLGGRRRVLHGRRTGAGAGHPTTRCRCRRGPGLRRDPVARRATRLLGHGRPSSKGTSPNWTIRSAPPPPMRWWRS